MLEFFINYENSLLSARKQFFVRVGNTVFLTLIIELTIKQGFLENLQSKSSAFSCFLELLHIEINFNHVNPNGKMLRCNIDFWQHSIFKEITHCLVIMVIFVLFSQNPNYFSKFINRRCFRIFSISSISFESFLEFLIKCFQLVSKCSITCGFLAGYESR